MTAVQPTIHPRLARAGMGTLRLVVSVLGALTIFGAFMLTKGVNPFQAYGDMWTSTFSSSASVSEIFVKASPLILAGLAVAVPARAGLVNVGGEGQIMVGAVAAAGMALVLGDALPGGLAVLLMGLAAALAGAAWAGITAVARLTVGINEAVSTLLLNYVAIDLLLFLIYDPWKDPAGVGQPTSKPISEAQHLPLLGIDRIHVGILLALGAAVLVWWALRGTVWGFTIRAIGGNPEAARRAGLRVGWLLTSAMLAGGALAGLGGFTQFAGVEYSLRPGFALGYGYIAFLASWLARHNPLKTVLAATVLAAIAIGGDSLQIDSALPAATVNILMALVLLAVFGWNARRPRTAT